MRRQRGTPRWRWKGKIQGIVPTALAVFGLRSIPTCRSPGPAASGAPAVAGLAPGRPPPPRPAKGASNLARQN